MKPIISVRDLGKMYRIRSGEKKRYLTLRDELAEGFRKLWHGKLGQSQVEEFWALKDINFDIYPGEVVGIIGRNGAGKSTLLKILSRITPPTTGEAILRGRVGSLLEVGTGFHPELTGRENIYLSGAILGMSRAEIKRKFDEIVAFAEIEKFIDTPVKRYSSGMYVRLGFAVAAHLEPEILVVDEVLAVGDAEFQKKCLGKMEEISHRQGKTILFVSHNMAAIQSLCTSALHIRSGQLAGYGKVIEQIELYLEKNNKEREKFLNKNNKLSPNLELIIFQCIPNPVKSGNSVKFLIKIVSHKRQSKKLDALSILIYNVKGIRIGILDLRRFDNQIQFNSHKEINLSVEVKYLNLVEGDYSIGLYIENEDIRENFMDLIILSVVSNDLNPKNITPYSPDVRGFIEFDFNLSETNF